MRERTWYLGPRLTLRTLKLLNFTNSGVTFSADSLRDRLDLWKAA